MIPVSSNAIKAEVSRGARQNWLLSRSHSATNSYKFQHNTNSGTNGKTFHQLCQKLETGDARPLVTWSSKDRIQVTLPPSLVQAIQTLPVKGLIHALECSDTTKGFYYPVFWFWRRIHQTCAWPLTIKYSTCITKFTQISGGINQKTKKLSPVRRLAISLDLQEMYLYVAIHSSCYHYLCFVVNSHR